MNVTRLATLSNPIVTGSSMKTFKICGVCGDVARCYHFGGLCCASCKAFFRRAVVNDQFKPYRCVYGGSCHIDVTSRKHCSHCRLKRCQSIGMDKKWFMSEEMRAELKLKSIKKLQRHLSNPQLLCVDPVGQLQRFPLKMHEEILSPSQIHEIHLLVDLTRDAYHGNVIPIGVQSDDCCSSSNLRTTIIFAAVIQRTFHFLESVLQLKRRDSAARTSLLKQRGMEALIVLSALTFNPAKRMWSQQGAGEGSTLITEPRPVHVCIKDFERLHGASVTRKHFDTITALLAMNADVKIIILLALVSFFSQDDQQDEAYGTADISAIQGHFIDLLKRYVRWKFGNLSESVFARFILKLSDVHEAHNLHKVARLQLSNDEIHQVEEQFGGLNLLNADDTSSPSPSH